MFVAFVAFVVFLRMLLASAKLLFTELLTEFQNLLFLSISSCFSLYMLYENLYGDVSHIKNLKKTPWIKEEVKTVEVKIYPPYLEPVLRRTPVNCEILVKNKEFVLLKLYYYTEEEAMNFIKKYLPSIKVMDEKLNKTLKDLLQNFLIRN